MKKERKKIIWVKMIELMFVLVFDWKIYLTNSFSYIEYNDYIVQLVPNIVNITYGRDVGYKIEQEIFDDAIHSISATKIRKDMGY
jgi:hypothetical protein